MYFILGYNIYAAIDIQDKMQNISNLPFTAYKYLQEKSNKIVLNQLPPPIERENRFERLSSTCHRQSA